jgi:uncharacterized protein (DUF58 family)
VSAAVARAPEESGRLPAELFRQVRRIEIRTRRLVQDLFSGQYHSVFKGRGIEFAEVREYEPGDDVRAIDWNVTARRGHPYVKQFSEERELTIAFLVDASASERFGSRGRALRELAAEMSAVLAFSALLNNDRVGLIVVTDRVERTVPPRKGRTHVLRVVREILFHRPLGRGTSLEAGLRHANRVLRRRSILFVVSDFLDSGFGPALRVANRKHDVIALRLGDPRLDDLPEAGLFLLEDPETGERAVWDAGSARARRMYRAARARRREETSQIFRQAKVDVIDLATDRPFVQPLREFFRERERRFR